MNVSRTCAGHCEANQKERTKKKNIHSTCNLCVGVSSGQLLMALVNWLCTSMKIGAALTSTLETSACFCVKWSPCLWGKANGRLHLHLLGTLFFNVTVRRWAFFQEESSTVSFVMWLNAALVHKIQVKPYPVMAALIGLADALSFVRNGECTMLTYFPSVIWVWEVEESTHVCPHTRNRPWTPQWCGPRRHQQGRVDENLFNGTDTIAVVASPSSPVEISSNHVHVFFKHHSADSKD